MTKLFLTDRYKFGYTVPIMVEMDSCPWLLLINLALAAAFKMLDTKYWLWQILFMLHVTCLNNKLLYSIFNPDTNLKIKLYHCNNLLLKGYYCRMMMRWLEFKLKVVESRLAEADDCHTWCSEVNNECISIQIYIPFILMDLFIIIIKSGICLKLLYDKIKKFLVR